MTRRNLVPGSPGVSPGPELTRQCVQARLQELFVCSHSSLQPGGRGVAGSPLVGGTRENGRSERKPERSPAWRKSWTCSQAFPASRPFSDAYPDTSAPKGVFPSSRRRISAPRGSTAIQCGASSSRKKSMSASRKAWKAARKRCSSPSGAAFQSSAAVSLQHRAPSFPGSAQAAAEDRGGRRDRGGAPVALRGSCGRKTVEAVSATASPPGRETPGASWRRRVRRETRARPRRPPARTTRPTRPPPASPRRRSSRTVLRRCRMPRRRSRSSGTRARSDIPPSGAGETTASAVVSIASNAFRTGPPLRERRLRRRATACPPRAAAR